jgi:ATP:ADP antiporter, AAA family
VLRLLEHLLPVRRGERPLTFTLFFHSLFAVGAFLTGRSVRDALFLAHGDRSTLAWMYVASAIAVTASGLLYSRLAVKVRRDVMALGTAGFFSVIFVALWLLEKSQVPFIYTAIYVLVEVMGAQVLVQFWTLANELFNAREAKRLYGFIGAGGTFANILIGLLSARVATNFGTASLLLMCAVLLLGAALASFWGGRLGKQRIFARAASGKPSAIKRTGAGLRVLSDKHLRAVAMLAAVTFFTTTLVDFQFKVIVADKLKGDELAAFFGYFSAVVGALALGLQLFGTSQLINRIGVIGALAVLPLFLAFGNLALILFPVLWAASATKGADTLFRYSVNDSTTQILYLPVPSQVRVAAKAFIDGVIKPSSIGLAGIVLAIYRKIGTGDPYRLAYISFLLSGVWLAVVAGLRSKYLKSLQENLKSRRLDLESARHRVIDGNTNSVLQKALASTDEHEVFNALSLLPSLEKVELDHKVEALLEHASPRIRTKTLEYYAQRQTMRFANSVFRRFEDPDAGVRAAAVDAFCAMGRDKAVRSVRVFLADPDPQIRSAAITGMIKFGGLDGVLVAAEALKDLISHTSPEMRRHAAKVLGAIGVKNFYQPILELMNDSELSVRREAVHAAGNLKSPEFVIPLIYKTKTRDTFREATTALAQYGDSVVQTLAKVMSNHVEDPAIRSAAAKVLGKLGSGPAVQVIAQHLEEPDSDVRSGMYRSLARAVKGNRLLLTDLSQVHKAIERELGTAFQALHSIEVLALDSLPSATTPLHGKEAARALLGSAMIEKIQRIEVRVFWLLGVLYPDADMEQISAGLHDASGADSARRRGNAVELLDNLLERNLKARVLPLIEESARTERLKQIAHLYVLPVIDHQAALTALCNDEVAWVRACALWCHAESTNELARPSIQKALSDAHPVVREMALDCLRRLSPQDALLAAQEALSDESSVVKKHAEFMLIQKTSNSPEAAS